MIGATECALASAGNQNQVTLAAAGCVADGPAAYSARTFGLLIWKPASSGSITLSNVSWKLGSTGIPLWPAAGVYTICGSPVVNGPSGQGYFCATVGVAKPYFGAAATYWVGVLLWQYSWSF